MKRSKSMSNSAPTVPHTLTIPEICEKLRERKVFVSPLDIYKWLEKGIFPSLYDWFVPKDEIDNIEEYAVCWNHHVQDPSRCCLCNQRIYKWNRQLEIRPTGPEFAEQPWFYCYPCWKRMETIRLTFVPLTTSQFDWGLL